MIGRLFEMKNSMEVTLFGPDPSNGGVGTYTEELALKMEDATALYFEPGSNPVEYLRASYRAIRASKKTIHVQYTYKLFGPIGILTFPLLLLWWFTTRLTGTKLVVTMHEVWDKRDASGYIKGSYAIVMHLCLAAFTDKLVFLSADAHATFQRHSIFETGTVISHGVPLNETMKINAPRSYFDIDENAFVVTQHGFVNRRKGFDAFVEIADHLPEYQFVIAGGPRNESFEEYYQEVVSRSPNNLHVTGVLDKKEFHAAFQASDLAILPYESIFQSGIFNWCAAYGVPTISSDIPYFQQLYDSYGVPQAFSTVEEACELVRKLEANEGDRFKLSRAIGRYAYENSFERVVEQHHEIYNN